MDDRLLLVKGITLAHNESRLENPEVSKDIVQKILGAVTLPETNITLDEISKSKKALMQLLQNIGTSAELMDTQSLIQQVRVAAGQDKSVFEAVKDGVYLPDEDAYKKSCVSLRRSLRDYFDERDATKILSDGISRLKFRRHEIGNFRTWLRELVASVECYTAEMAEFDPAIVSDVSFDDPESMEKVYDSIKKDAGGESILQCGYQGVNRMLRGGFRRGDEVVISALQHNYKTGFSLSLFMQLCMYNKPVMRDLNKKPLMLRISFEDDINLNMQFVYSRIIEQRTGLPPTSEELAATETKEIAKTVRETLTATGYHVKMMRVDPTKWTYMDLINKMLEYEAQGFEIHVCMVDYLYMIPTTGCVQGPAGVDVRDMFRRMRNFTNPRGITFMTPHQLSTDAKQKIREGQSDFVKEMPGKGYYAGSKQIDQEVDIEIFIHIEILSGKSWLTIQRGKHRIVGVTPREHQYCAYQFQQTGSILDDINGKDQSRIRIGGGAYGSGEEIPSWDIQPKQTAEAIF